MLIGETADTQAVCVRALGDARPIHVHCDVRMPDLLEWRIKISMSRADLDVSLKFGVRTSVIDRDYVTTLQLRCHELDPAKRRLIKLHVVIDQSLNENKFIAIDANKFLPAVADQAHGHRVQQFVRKMDAHEWLQRTAPFNLIAK
jgi:seryl-tRNA(Sec) selenium transferase